VLVTTPIHLRALLRDGATLPPLQAIVTATAPLEQELAAEAERQFAAPVIEVFGSTETCVIAHRRTVHDEPWQLYSGVELHPQPDGTLVQAAHFAAPTLLQDIVELLPSRQFVLRGRNSDLLEIAGKRASLSDLNRRLLAIAGVEDGVMFALDAEGFSVCRLAALPSLRRVRGENHRGAAPQSIRYSCRGRCASSAPPQRHGKIAARRTAAGVAH
jgi:acyl-coenzyme A synthetase/AMP-(fatty) acid ligase